MQFDAVKTGLHGVARGGTVLAHDLCDLAHRQRTRCRCLHEARRAAVFASDEHVHALGLEGRRRYRLAATQQARVAQAPNVPELREDAPAVGMHSVGHLAPARDLLGGVDAGRPRVALAERRHIRAFTDDETGARTLRVVRGHQFVGDIAGLARTRAGHWRHDDAVRQCQRAELQRLEQRVVLHDVDSLWRMWGKFSPTPGPAPAGSPRGHCAPARRSAPCRRRSGAASVRSGCWRGSRAWWTTE